MGKCQGQGEREGGEDRVRERARARARERERETETETETERGRTRETVMFSPDFIFTFTLILHSIATWSDWGQWQSCSSSCGGGTRHRVTVCGDLNSEGDSSKGDSCGGEAPRQTEKM